MMPCEGASAIKEAGDATRVELIERIGKGRDGAPAAVNRALAGDFDLTGGRVWRRVILCRPDRQAAVPEPDRRKPAAITR
jgi:hypothetical protein